MKKFQDLNGFNYTSARLIPSPSALLVNSSLWVQMLRSSCISDFWRFLQGLYELYHRICYFVFVFVIIVSNIQELCAAQHA